MRLEEGGRIIDDFYVTGHPGAPVYLLDGPKPVLFDSGYTALGPVYEKDIKGVLGNREPAALFLTHSHFDHIGSASHLKRVWPGMQVLGSERLGDVLNRPNAVSLITFLSSEAAKVLGSWGLKNLHDGPFEPFRLDGVVGPDQTMELGPDLTVKCIATPGHTWDFMSYFIPEKGILIASEAAGCEDGSGYILTEFLVDYDEYRKSMERLSELDFQVLCLGHKFVLTGEDARGHIGRSMAQAEAYVAMIEGFLQEEGGDMDKTVSRVKSAEWDAKPDPKQPERMYVINTRVRVETIWKRLQKAKR